MQLDGARCVVSMAAPTGVCHGANNNHSASRRTRCLHLVDCISQTEMQKETRCDTNFQSATFLFLALLLSTCPPCPLTAVTAGERPTVFSVRPRLMNRCLMSGIGDVGYSTRHQWESELLDGPDKPTETRLGYLPSQCQPKVP